MQTLAVFDRYRSHRWLWLLTLLLALGAVAWAGPANKEPFADLPIFAKAEITDELEVSREELMKLIPSSRDLVKNLQRVKLTNMIVKGTVSLNDILDFYDKEIVAKGNRSMMRTSPAPDRAMSVYKSSRQEGLIAVLTRTDKKNFRAGIMLVQTLGMIDLARLKDLSAVLFTLMEADSADPFSKPLSLPLYPGAEQTVKMQIGPENIDAKKISEALVHNGEPAIALDAIVNLLKVCKGLEINTYKLKSGGVTNDVFAFYEKSITGQGWILMFKNTDTPEQAFGMFRSSEQGLAFINVDQKDAAIEINAVLVKGRLSDLVNAFLKAIGGSKK